MKQKKSTYLCSEWGIQHPWHMFTMKHLLTNQSENVQQNLADRACNPSKQDEYRLFSKLRQTEMGDDHGEGLFEQLQHEVAVYNEKWEGQGGKAKFQPFTLGNDENNNTDEADSDDPEVSNKRENKVNLLLWLFVYH